MTETIETPQTLQEPQAAPQIPVDSILLFLKKYREMEKATYKVANNIFYSAFPRSMTASYLIDRWRWKKKNFGDFYLNLDTVNQIRFLHYWGLVGAEDANFLEQYEADKKVALFYTPPLPALMRKVLLFFCNNGITKQIWFRDSTPEEFDFSFFPKKEKCFGNSSNWADFVLSLPRSEQDNLLAKITIHYKG